jgi:hypothetical protein
VNNPAPAFELKCAGILLCVGVFGLCESVRAGFRRATGRLIARVPLTWNTLIGPIFQLLLLGYLERPDSKRAIVWRAAESLTIHSFGSRAAKVPTVARLIWVR